MEIKTAKELHHLDKLYGVNPNLKYKVFTDARGREIGIPENNVQYSMPDDQLIAWWNTKGGTIL